MPKSIDPSPAEYALPAGYTLDPELRSRLLSPSLVLFLDRARANIASVLRLLGQDPNRWRPHIKTIKTPEVLALLVQAGIRQFKCATPREADCLAGVLASEGVRGAHILLAYPLLGPGLERLAQVAAQHPKTRFAVLAECPQLALQIPRTLGIFVDVNAGMNRTGIPLSERGAIRAVAQAAGQRLEGLHAYDGDRHESDPDLRTRRLDASYAELAELVGELREQGLVVPEIITAGTPALLDASRARAFAPLSDLVHRVSPGTVVLHDLRSAEENPGLELAPAALLFTRVVSHPAPGRFTCDAGSKSLAAEAEGPCASVLGAPELLVQEPSEEHLPIVVPGGVLPPRGTELLLVPRHVCPTVNLAEQAIVIEAGQPPKVAKVAARAHELLLDREP